MGLLTGKRVVNTRAPHQAGELDDLLRERGAVPLAYPCVEIVPTADQQPLRDALRVLERGGFDWLVLTSVNTVHALELVAQQEGLNLVSHTPVAAVGPATAAAALRLGLEVSVVPERHDGPTLAAAIPVRPGQRVFLPASQIARRKVETALIERGAEVTAVAAYRTVVGAGGVELPRLLREGAADAVTLASSSAVDGLVTRLTAEGGAPALLARVPLVCIGAKTRATARERGFETAVAAKQSTLAGLIEALKRVLAPNQEGGAAWSRAS